MYESVRRIVMGIIFLIAYLIISEKMSELEDTESSL